MAEDVPMDEVDLAFDASLVPDGCVSQGFIAVSAYFDEHGDQKFKVYSQLDMVLSGQLGLLELAKRSLIKRCEDEFGDDF